MANLPAPFSEIPRLKLLFDRATPIEKLERLSTLLGNDTTIWINREDCNSGLAFGGNKIRKLEYVLPDAIAQGADTLVTVGGLQSNHMRQVTAAAARCGLKVGQAARRNLTMIADHRLPHELDKPHSRGPRQLGDWATFNSPI